MYTIALWMYLLLASHCFVTNIASFSMIIKKFSRTNQLWNRNYIKFIERYQWLCIESKSSCNNLYPFYRCAHRYHRLLLQHQRYVSSNNSLDDEILSNDDSTNSTKFTWLVVGDGDLSYSVQLARSVLQTFDLSSSSLHERKSETQYTLNNNSGSVKLIATVNEDQETHRKIYERSEQNDNSIRSLNGVNEQVSFDALFGVDATQLQRRFRYDTLDRITFNFPHWQGKANNRYNRELINKFLQSASNVLSKKNGEIEIALIAGQGGMEATNSIEWKASWMVGMYAAEYGLLVRRIEPFHVQYNLSSYRGIDKSFRVGLTPLKYIIGWPSEQSIDEQYQIAVRHELRIVLDPDVLRNSKYSSDDLVHGNVIPDLIQSVIPRGIRCVVPLRDVVTPIRNDRHKWEHTPLPIVVFLIVYSGEAYPLTRSLGDCIRSDVERVVETNGFQITKKGHVVSKPFPFRIF